MFRNAQVFQYYCNDKRGLGLLRVILVKGLIHRNHRSLPEKAFCEKSDPQKFVVLWITVPTPNSHNKNRHSYTIVTYFCSNENATFWVRERFWGKTEFFQHWDTWYSLMYSLQIVKFSLDQKAVTIWVCVTVCLLCDYSGTWRISEALQYTYFSGFLYKWT